MNVLYFIASGLLVLEIILNIALINRNAASTPAGAVVRLFLYGPIVALLVYAGVVL